MTIGLHKDAQIKVKCQKTMYQARCFHQVCNDMQREPNRVSLETGA